MRCWAIRSTIIQMRRNYNSLVIGCRMINVILRSCDSKNIRTPDGFFRICLDGDRQVLAIGARTEEEFTWVIWQKK
jgi:hypothetical protein